MQSNKDNKDNKDTWSRSAIFIVNSEEISHIV